MATIVVGTDGSTGAVAALRWAVEEARLRDADVEVVHAFADPPLTAYPTLVLPAIPSEELREAAERVVAAAIAEVDTDGVEVRSHVAAGGAAGVLCDRAKDAELLVVGTRGRGGFRGLLLGSVSQQVVTHAPCPVVTIGAGAAG